MNDRLAGRSAYVTGASRGIGRGIALALAAEGASVIVTDIAIADTESVAAEIRAVGGRAEALVVDVTKWGDLLAVVDLAERHCIDVNRGNRACSNR